MRRDEAKKRDARRRLLMDIFLKLLPKCPVKEGSDGMDSSGLLRIGVFAVHVLLPATDISR